MTLKDYLQSHANKTLTLVGPLLEQPRTFSHEPLVFVDGGSRFRSDKTGFAVGDGDSSSAPLDEKLPTRKNFSDLGYVLGHADDFEKIEAWGFWGGRKDHELANLGEFHQYLKRQTGAEVSLPPLARGFSSGEWSFNFTGAFSLFLLDQGSMRITGGVQYPLLQLQEFAPLSSRGLSNEAHGLFQVHSSVPFFLFHQF